MAFFFTIVFMFLVFWRPQEWLLPWLYGLPLLDAVVYLSILALLVESHQGRVSIPMRKPQIYLLAGLWLAAIASQAVHAYFAGMQTAATDVFKICFFTLLLYCVLDSPSKLRHVCRIFVITAVIMAIHALMQDRLGRGFRGQWPLWIPSMQGNPPYTRSVFFGIFSDPNDLAQALVTAIPMSFAMTKRMNVVSILLGCAVSWLLFEAFLTTHSRGGAVALAAVGLVMVYLLLPPRWMPYLAGIGLVAALALCRTKGGALLDMSARERVIFWGFGNQAFKSNPIFGIGYDMYWQIGSGRPAHNAFVTCYTELGLVGYWMWFSFLFLGISGTWRSRLAAAAKRTDEQRYLYRSSGFLLASIGGFAASAYFLSRTFVYPMFFLMALVNAVPRIAESEVPEEADTLAAGGRRDLVWRAAAATLASVVYIYLSIVLLNQAYVS